MSVAFKNRPHQWPKAPFNFGAARGVSQLDAAALTADEPRLSKNSIVMREGRFGKLLALSLNKT